MATITGTAASDDLSGTTGDDVIYGLGSGDSLAGLEGDDVLEGGEGEDVLSGSGGTDTASYRDKDERVWVKLSGSNAGQARAGGVDGPVEDTLWGIENLWGSDYSDHLIGDDGDNALNGYAGSDTLRGGGGIDRLEGGDGVDAADFRDRTVGVVLALNGSTTVRAVIGGVNEDYVRNIENIYGGSGDDVLAGDANDNRLSGGAGDDVLSGGAGRDRYDGGEGRDALDFRSIASGGTISLSGGYANDGEYPENIENIEDVYGSAGANHIIGNDQENRLLGSGGDDRIQGGGGFDTLDGGSGFDMVDYLGAQESVEITLIDGQAVIVTIGGVVEDRIKNFEGINGGYASDDILIGSESANLLHGSGGNDVLIGGGGDDRLRGGPGANELTGGSGADAFEFLDPPSFDRILDFSAEDELRIFNDYGFRAVGWEGALPGTAFHSGPGATAATTAAHRIIYDTTSGDLYFDADGVGGTAAVLFANLVGAPTLSAADIWII
jgi:Ca2+-binding RTX toxin-like protein